MATLLGAAGAADRQARAAFRRRESTAAKVEWYGQQVERGITMGMRTRLNLAAQLLKDQVKVNISRPVHKYAGSRSGTIQVDPDSRSKPGEYPKQETSRLMNSIFHKVVNDHEAIVGTPLGYGLLLETRMDRSFLRRTLREQMPQIRRILLMGPRLPGQRR